MKIRNKELGRRAKQSRRQYLAKLKKNIKQRFKQQQQKTADLHAKGVHNRMAKIQKARATAVNKWRQNATFFKNLQKAKGRKKK
jgi:adenylyl- and sulfurtransferase ThiI